MYAICIFIYRLVICFNIYMYICLYALLTVLNYNACLAFNVHVVNKERETPTLKGSMRFYKKKIGAVFHLRSVLSVRRLSLNGFAIILFVSKLCYLIKKAIFVIYINNNTMKRILPISDNRV